tara:strand:- start:1482 stop:1835 length:354 start_codon:yes stop_codon:yes gene_type:complete
MKYQAYDFNTFKRQRGNKLEQLVATCLENQILRWSLTTNEFYADGRKVRRAIKDVVNELRHFYKLKGYSTRQWKTAIKRELAYKNPWNQPTGYEGYYDDCREREAYPRRYQIGAINS